MKIAVCIPVYNFDVRPLVSELKAQIKTASSEIEIVLIDDRSEPYFTLLNLELTHTVARFISLDKNVGRAKIRNLFVKYTEADYLLFLDCDVHISVNFLENYASFLKGNTNVKVVYGGRTVTENRTEKNALRWDFAHHRENLPPSLRKRKPHLSFQSNNFLIHRDVLEKVKFDENITGYGYEDVIFGLQLKEQNINISHIENPVISGPLEDNDRFIQKSGEAAVNLALFIKNKDHLVQDIKLVRAFKIVMKFKLIFILHSFLSLDKALARVQNRPNLRNLDLFKLAVLWSIMKVQK